MRRCAGIEQSNCAVIPVQVDNAGVQLTGLDHEPAAGFEHDLDLKLCPEGLDRGDQGADIMELDVVSIDMWDKTSGGGFWFNVRASNTEPLLRLNAEAKDQATLDALLEEITLNPVMGEYLSMKGNRKPEAAENIQPDENYARELLQLFSIGQVLLNDDGSA